VSESEWLTVITLAVCIIAGVYEWRRPRG